MYSGGEIFDINLAFRIALSKVLAQRASFDCRRSSFIRVSARRTAAGVLIWRGPSTVSRTTST